MSKPTKVGVMLNIINLLAQAGAVTMLYFGIMDYTETVLTLILFNLHSLKCK